MIEKSPVKNIFSTYLPYIFGCIIAQTKIFLEMALPPYIIFTLVSLKLLK